MNNFAGAICTGIGCLPFLILFLINVLIYAIPVTIVTWQIVKRVLKTKSLKNKFKSKNKRLVVHLISQLIVYGVLFIIWQVFLNSNGEFLKNRSKDEFFDNKITHLQGLEPEYYNVDTFKSKIYKDSLYELVSYYRLPDGSEVELEETFGGAHVEFYKKYSNNGEYVCKFTPKNNEYCSNNHGQYYIDFNNMNITLYLGGEDDNKAINLIDNFEVRIVQDRDKVRFDSQDY